MNGFMRIYEKFDIIIPDEINKLCLNYYFQPFIIDTKILDENEKYIFQSLLNEQNINVLKLNRIYSSSTDGCDAKTCNNKCRSSTFKIKKEYINNTIIYFGATVYFCDVGGSDIMITGSNESTNVTKFDIPSPYYLNGGKNKFNVKEMEVFTFNT